MLDLPRNIILSVIDEHQSAYGRTQRLDLRAIKSSYLQKLESKPKLKSNASRLGEYVSQLYLEGYIENRNGYRITRKGKKLLQAEKAFEGRH